jgi:hypothetical protein
MVYSKKKRSSNKNSIKNRRRRSAGRRNTFPESSEAATLRSELVAIHKSYRSILQEKDEEIEALNRLNAEASSFIFHQTKSHVAAVKEFETKIAARKAIIEDIQNDLDITEGELSIVQTNEKQWIGRTLKMKFILDEIVKIGALPSDHAEWVHPMIEDIDIPEVSINIRDEFIPTVQTENIDWTDDEGNYDEEEEDIIEDYLDNETSDNNAQINATAADIFIYHRLTHYPRAILEMSAKTIQKAWKNHQNQKKQQLDKELDEYMAHSLSIRRLDCATKIQSVWRGYSSRKLYKAKEEKVEEEYGYNEYEAEMREIYESKERHEIDEWYENEEDNADEEWVAFRSRLRAFDARYLCKKISATKIQSVWRGYKSRSNTIR